MPSYLCGKEAFIIPQITFTSNILQYDSKDNKLKDAPTLVQGIPFSFDFVFCD